MWKVGYKAILFYVVVVYWSNSFIILLLHVTALIVCIVRSLSFIRIIVQLFSTVLVMGHYPNDSERTIRVGFATLQRFYKFFGPLVSGDVTAPEVI